MTDSEFADKVAKECLNLYKNLAKKGKPISGKEWTLLSCVVMTLDEKITVVSLATGTKCLGRNLMCPRGDVINDSHAEVLARRCFLRYLYDQISKFKINGVSDIITSCDERNRYEINPKVKFHFYSSHVPCGDASIIPKCGSSSQKRKLECHSNGKTKRKKTEDGDPEDVFVKEDLSEEQYTRTSRPTNAAGSPDPKSSEEMKFDSNLISNDAKSVEFEITCSDSEIDGGKEMQDEDCVGELVDIHRTGAKCVAGQDSRLPGALYHVVGAVRTKPGRGDPTLSVSCSDKLARWIACGIQGALLSLLLTRPVVLDCVVVGSGGPYSPDVLHRAIVSRTGTSHRPRLLQTSHVFPHSRYVAGPTARPCPSAILWTAIGHKPVEVCVEGRRQGATKKCRDNGRLMVCKLELLRTFLSLSGAEYRGLTYRDIKVSADQYNSVWAHARSMLGAWTTKPSHLESFMID